MANAGERLAACVEGLLGETGDGAVVIVGVVIGDVGGGIDTDVVADGKVGAERLGAA